MKKVFKSIIALAGVITFSFGVVGCSKCDEHTAGNGWILDETYHWHECTECGEKVDKEEHEAGSDWVIGETHHWHECSDCGQKLEVEEHEWGSPIVWVESIDQESLVLKYSCNTCGANKYEKTVYTIVSATEWNHALNPANYNKFQIRTVESGKDDYQILNVDGSKIYSEFLDTGVLTVKYYNKEQDKYYKYTKDGSDWVKTETTQTEYESVLNQVNLALSLESAGLEYSDFVYNTSTRAYEVDLGDGVIGKIYFQLKKLVKIEMNGLETHIKYENVEVELPIN